MSGGNPPEKNSGRYRLKKTRDKTACTVVVRTIEKMASFITVSVMQTGEIFSPDVPCENK